MLSRTAVAVAVAETKGSISLHRVRAAYSCH